MDYWKRDSCPDEQIILLLRFFFLPKLSFAGDIKTSLLSGSSFNVTWHLAYPHKVSDNVFLPRLDPDWMLSYFFFTLKSEQFYDDIFIYSSFKLPILEISNFKLMNIKYILLKTLNIQKICKSVNILILVISKTSVSWDWLISY